MKLPSNTLHWIGTAVVMVASVLPAGAARADFCGLVDVEVAKNALERVSSVDHVLRFCGPCDYDGPGSERKPTRLAVKSASLSDDKRTLQINSKDVDLALLYVETAKHRYLNLGLISGCAQEAGPATLQFPATVPDEKTRALWEGSWKSTHGGGSLTLRFISADQLVVDALDIDARGNIAQASGVARLRGNIAMFEGIEGCAGALWISSRTPPVTLTVRDSFRCGGLNATVSAEYRRRAE